jgi:beta-lactamase class A
MIRAKTMKGRVKYSHVVLGTLSLLWLPMLVQSVPLRLAQEPQSLSKAVFQPWTGVAPQDDLSDLVKLPDQPSELQQHISKLKSQYPSLSGYEVSVHILNLADNSFVDVDGDAIFSAASIIKLPILIAFFQDIDAGKINLNETLTIAKEDIAGGSGDMQDLPPGTTLPILQVVTEMITHSDNTATNLIIKRMGGIQPLNDRFKAWGLRQTRLYNLLPDLDGTNNVTAKELTRLLLLLHQGKLLSPQSQAQAIDIMQHVRNRNLLAAGIEEGAAIAHKTGDIGFMLGDSGLVTLADGKQYIITVLVTSTYDDGAAQNYIQTVSRLMFQHLSPSTAASEPEKAEAKPEEPIN